VGGLYGLSGGPYLMPFKSKAQEKWMFANHPEMAKRWADETPDIKDLPDKVEKVKESLKKMDKYRTKK
jgi:hypothetical protein